MASSTTTAVIFLGIVNFLKFPSLKISQKNKNAQIKKGKPANKPKKYIGVKLSERVKLIKLTMRNPITANVRKKCLILIALIVYLSLLLIKLNTSFLKLRDSQISLCPLSSIKT